MYSENENHGDIAAVGDGPFTAVDRKQRKGGKTTVGEIRHRCMDAGLTYDQASHMTNNELRELL